MFFKLTMSLNGIYVRRESDLPVSVPLDTDTQTTFWMREVDHQGQRVKQLCVDLIAERVVPHRVELTLRELRHNRLVLDNPVQEGIPYSSLDGPIVDETGQVRDNWAVPLSLLPRGARPWLEALHRELGDRLTAYIRTLRWRQAASSGHQPFSSVGIDWSDDREIWTYVPRNFAFSVSRSASIDISEARLTDAAKLLADGYSEPFAHELIREARILSDSAPRSALLIAFSALETGLKSYLNYLLPDGDALIEKIPSPPVVTLIRDVIPSIHNSRGICSPGLPISNSALAELQKWVTQRNQVAHGAKRSVDQKGLRAIIDLIVALLYVFDAARGHDWASENMKSIEVC